MQQPEGQPSSRVDGPKKAFGESEQYLRKLLDSVTDPLVMYDRKMRIIQVNQAVASLVKKPRRECIGKRRGDLFQKKGDGAEETCLHEVLTTGEPRTYEEAISLPDGTRRHFELHFYPIRAADGKTIQVIEHGRDISIRKNLESELRASEQRYRTIVEAAREGIYILDYEAVITFANRRLTRMLGYQSNELLGRSIYELLDGEAQEVAKEKFERRKQGLSDVYELRLLRKDGTVLHGLISVAPLMDNGLFTGCMGILTDITCLKTAEAALQAATAFGEKIINSITDNLAVIEPVSYMILRANRSFGERVGIADPEALVGKKCYEVLLNKTAPCVVDGCQCPVQETFRTRRPAACERIYRDALGQERVYHLTTYPLLNDQGEVESVIRLERDVTEKQSMEKALAFRSSELYKIQHRLEMLFEISRQVGAKRSLPELVQFLHAIIQKIFPGSDPLFLILNAAGDRILALEKCDPGVSSLLQNLQHRLDQSGLNPSFIRYLRKTKASEITASSGNMEYPPFFKVLCEGFPSWFALQICVQEQCIGLFLLGSRAPREYPSEDLRFLHAIFEQSSGHLGHLVNYEEEINLLRQQVAERTSCGDMIGQSKIMQEIYELVDLVSGSDATVLITGENGTGKELVAHAIHRQSHRHKGPFVVANCSAYSPTLLESELFGHEKGSFTGAIRQKKGRIERAHGGTLFLDEIGDIAPATQILLLRFLQDHCFERVGGERTIATDVRILAATNRNLQQEVQSVRFRDDLYYRLNVISIHLPPLRDRKEDIPLLAGHFLKRYSAKEQKKVLSFSSDAMRSLMDYDWPGNVRQLENAVSHAMVLCQGEYIRRRHLPRFLREMSEEEASSSLADNERLLIMRALKETNWNKHDAARRLRVSRSTLYSKIRRYGLEPLGMSV